VCWKAGRPDRTFKTKGRLGQVLPGVAPARKPNHTTTNSSGRLIWLRGRGQGLGVRERVESLGYRGWQSALFSVQPRQCYLTGGLDYLQKLKVAVVVPNAFGEVDVPLNHVALKILEASTKDGNAAVPLE